MAVEARLARAVERLWVCPRSDGLPAKLDRDAATDGALEHGRKEKCSMQWQSSSLGNMPPGDIDPELQARLDVAASVIHTRLLRKIAQVKPQVEVAGNSRK